MGKHSLPSLSYSVRFKRAVAPKIRATVKSAKAKLKAKVPFTVAKVHHEYYPLPEWVSVQDLYLPADFPDYGERYKNLPWYLRGGASPEQRGDVPMPVWGTRANPFARKTPPPPPGKIFEVRGQKYLIKRRRKPVVPSDPRKVDVTVPRFNTLKR